MFERFSREARLAVVDAQEQAREAGSHEIAPEHILLALRRQDDGTGRYLAGRLGDTEWLAARFRQVRRRAGITGADARALEEIGIDVDRIVEAVERAHGENALTPGTPRSGAGWFRRRWSADGAPKGRVPFATEAKRVMAQSLKETAALGDQHIGGEHLLLALLGMPGTVSDVLADEGVDYLDARRALRGGSGQANAG